MHVNLVLNGLCFYGGSGLTSGLATFAAFARYLKDKPGNSLAARLGIATRHIKNLKNYEAEMLV